MHDQGVLFGNNLHVFRLKTFYFFEYRGGFMALKGRNIFDFHADFFWKNLTILQVGTSCLRNP